MFLRAMIAAAFAAALLPVSAHASCLDDLQAGLDDGYTGNTPKSEHWSLGYVHQEGTATVHVYGDDLVADHTANALDWVRYTQTIAGNAPDGAVTFVDCVAG